MASSGKAAGGASIEYVAIRMAAALAIVTGTNTLVTMDTLTTADPFGYFAAGTPGRLTVPAGHGGTFLLSGAIEFAPVGGGSRVLKPRLNGANMAPTPSVPAGDAANSTVLEVVRVLPMAAGDFVELWVYQEAAGNVNVNAAAPANPFLSLVRLGA